MKKASKRKKSLALLMILAFASVVFLFAFHGNKMNVPNSSHSLTRTFSGKMLYDNFSDSSLDTTRKWCVTKSGGTKPIPEPAVANGQLEVITSTDYTYSSTNYAAYSGVSTLENGFYRPTYAFKFEVSSYNTNDTNTEDYQTILTVKRTSGEYLFAIMLYRPPLYYIKIRNFVNATTSPCIGTWSPGPSCSVKINCTSTGIGIYLNKILCAWLDLPESDGRYTFFSIQHTGTGSWIQPHPTVAVSVVTYIDDVKCYAEERITLENLRPLQRIELYASDGTLKASATVPSLSSNITLEASSLDFPFSGYFKIYDPNGTLEDASQTWNDIWGGDSYAYTKVPDYPKVLFVTDTVSPSYLNDPDSKRAILTDLFRAGIPVSVTSMTVYKDLDTTEYSVIVLDGYANPEGLQTISDKIQKDVNEGRKTIVVDEYCYQNRTAENTVSKVRHLFRQLGMPGDEFNTTQRSFVSFISYPDNYWFKYWEQGGCYGNCTHYFSLLPDDATGWIKTPSNEYVMIITSKGAWISLDIAYYVDYGKIIAKLVYNDTMRVGFSYDVAFGKRIFVLREDSDRGNVPVNLNWLSSVLSEYPLKMSLSIRGETWNSTVAELWQDKIVSEPNARIGVHTWTHKMDYNVNMTHEVFDTYQLLQDPPIDRSKVDKLWMVWGSSDYNSSQLKDVLDMGFLVQHSREGEREEQTSIGKYVNTPFYFAETFVVPANLSSPQMPILGNTGIDDAGCYNSNWNFTQLNINRFNNCTEWDMPFIVYIHDFTGSRAGNGGADQVSQFLSWISKQQICSMWLIDYLQIWKDAEEGFVSYTNSNGTLTVNVHRPYGNANFVKIYVGTEDMYAEGPEILQQSLQDGWLYVTLEAQKDTVFTVVRRGNMSIIANNSATADAKNGFFPFIVVATSLFIRDSPGITFLNRVASSYMNVGYCPIVVATIIIFNDVKVTP